MLAYRLVDAGRPDGEIGVDHPGIGVADGGVQRIGRTLPVVKRLLGAPAASAAMSNRIRATS